MTKCFAGEDIRQVHFYKGYLDTEQSIAKSDAGMGEGTGIDNNKTDIVLFGIVNMLDELKLGIALHSGKAVAGICGLSNQCLVNVLEGLCAVVFWLSRSE